MQGDYFNVLAYTRSTDCSCWQEDRLCRCLEKINLDNDVVKKH